MLPSEAVFLQSRIKALRLLFLAKKAEAKLLLVLAISQNVPFVLTSDLTSVLVLLCLFFLRL
jgi:hypothetical protein